VRYHPTAHGQPLQMCSPQDRGLGCHSYSAFTSQNTMYRARLDSTNCLLAPRTYTSDRSSAERWTESGRSSRPYKSYWAVCSAGASASLAAKGGDKQPLEFVGDLGAPCYHPSSCLVLTTSDIRPKAKQVFIKGT